MPRLEIVERKIESLEGFCIRVTYNGKNVRGDKEGFPQWPWQNKSKDNMTVDEWRNKFKSVYVGYDVDVIKQDGNVAFGQMLLKNVRGYW